LHSGTPAWASFKDMVALKGKPTSATIAPLANANKLSDMPDINRPGFPRPGPRLVGRAFSE
jgi:type I restriction enzyme M protein